MMNIVELPIIGMMSICFYVGFYYLFMYLRRTKHRENLTFSLTCFSIALYDLSCLGLYGSASLGEGISFQRWQFITNPLIAISLSWFVVDFTQYRKRKAIYFFSLLFLVGILINIFHTGELTLTMDKPLVKQVIVGNLVDITYYEGEPGIVPMLQIVTFIIFFIFLLYLLIKFYRIKKKKGFIFIFISLFLFFVAVFNDSMVSSGVYSFIYVTEYSFMVVVFAMAYAMLNRFVDLSEEVEVLNVGLEQKVQERTTELEAANEELRVINEELIRTRDSLWGEMELAKKIQTVLIPKDPRIRGYDIAAYMEPTAEVGGDYYDIINVVGMDWLIIGDVSGHGVPAGLIMMMAQTAIQNTLNQNPILDPSELLTIINKTMSNNIRLLNEDKYMTITVFAVHKDGKFTFSGLHQDIMIYRARSKKVEVIGTNGMWIGFDFKIQDMFRNDTVELDVGDVMLVYTDGITEAWNEAISGREKSMDNMFGNERLAQAFNRLAEHPPETIINGILKELEGYQFNDDVTMVALKRLNA